MKVINFLHPQRLRNKRRHYLNVEILKTLPLFFQTRRARTLGPADVSRGQGDVLLRSPAVELQRKDPFV